ncbi:MAG: exported protein of unknown function [Rickettsiaceae bacterium]|jgi:hypothetical protein|nr:exported protein of unknown function [Rickettsiaceae bacterium]
MKKCFLLLLPLLINSCGSSSEEIEANAREVATFPRYGNYCGYDRPTNGEMPKPTDEVDAACKNHDACYDKQGTFNVDCDTALITELKNMSPKTEPEKVARKLIISYFRNSPQKHLMKINFNEIKF